MILPWRHLTLRGVFLNFGWIFGKILWVDFLVRRSLIVPHRICRVAWRNSSTHRTYLLRNWTATILKFWQLTCRRWIQIRFESVNIVSVAALNVQSSSHLISAFIICDWVIVLHFGNLFRIIAQIDDFVSRRSIQSFTTLIYVLVSEIMLQLRRLLTLLVYYIWFFTFAENVLT